MEKTGSGAYPPRTQILLARTAARFGSATWLLRLALLTAAAACGGGGGGDPRDGGATGGGDTSGEGTGSNGATDADGGVPVKLACSGQGGGIEGGWRAKKAHVNAVLFSGGGVPESEEQDLVVPELAVEPLSGVEARVIHEIDGDKRRTYVWPKGKKYHYVLSESLLQVDESYVPMGPNGAGGALGGGLTELLELKDGCLVSTSSYFGSGADGAQVSLTNEVTFDRVQGPLPPSDWPNKEINVPTGSTP